MLGCRLGVKVGGYTVCLSGKLDEENSLLASALFREDCHVMEKKLSAPG